jgi:hypothetical protein
MYIYICMYNIIYWAVIYIYVYMYVHIYTHIHASALLSRDAVSSLSLNTHNTRGGGGGSRRGGGGGGGEEEVGEERRRGRRRVWGRREEGVDQGIADVIHRGRGGEGERGGGGGWGGVGGAGGGGDRHPWSISPPRGRWGERDLGDTQRHTQREELLNPLPVRPT